MKKLLSYILALLALVYLAFMVGMEINSIHAFITIDPDLLTYLGYVETWGGLALVASSLLVFFWGKGLKILMLLITILVIAAGVVAFFFPGLITSIFA